MENLSYKAGEPALPAEDAQASRKPLWRQRVLTVVRNPLTLVLFTWLVMAILLWLEVLKGTR